MIKTALSSSQSVASTIEMENGCCCMQAITGAIAAGSNAWVVIYVALLRWHWNVFTISLLGNISGKSWERCLVTLKGMSCSTSALQNRTSALVVLS